MFNWFYIIIIIDIIFVYLCIAAIAFSILKKSKKKILIIIIAIILLMVASFDAFIRLYSKKNAIAIFLRSSEYKNADQYDYSNDIATYGFITRDGAIKIAYEYVNDTNHNHFYSGKGNERIAELNSYKVENGTVEYLVDNGEIGIGRYRFEEKQASYWEISFITNWTYGNHIQRWFIKVDLYTGEILNVEIAG